jgi:integrase
MPKQVTPRRAKGTGAHFWSKTLQLYVGRIWVGGKRYERRAATVAELNTKLEAIRPPGPTTTVREWWERWISNLSVRPSTLADYRHTGERYVIPTLGSFRVSDLTSHDVESAVARWANMPRKNRSGGLTGNTARKNLRQFRGCMEAARRARLIPFNPVRDARGPRAKKVRTDPFTPDELLAIATAPGAGIYALLASIGCRLGEAIALDVGDLDPASGIISITKTHDAKHGTRPPKSENGVRTVRVPRQALPVVIACVGTRKRGPLFPNKGGGRREHSSVRYGFRSLLKRLGLRYRSPHQLRHGLASLWVSRGVGLAEVAARIGDSLAMVVKTYVHPLDDVDPTDATEAAWG